MLLHLERQADIDLPEANAAYVQMGVVRRNTPEGHAPGPYFRFEFHFSWLRFAFFGLVALTLGVAIYLFFQ